MSRKSNPGTSFHHSSPSDGCQEGRGESSNPAPGSIPGAVFASPLRERGSRPAGRVRRGSSSHQTVAERRMANPRDAGSTPAPTIPPSARGRLRRTPGIVTPFFQDGNRPTAQAAFLFISGVRPRKEREFFHDKNRSRTSFRPPSYGGLFKRPGSMSRRPLFVGRILFPVDRRVVLRQSLRKRPVPDGGKTGRRTGRAGAVARINGQRPYR